MLLKWPLVLLPVHIVFLELIIDPACSIVFEAEPEESGIMDRPPRNQNENLFGRKAVLLSALQGLSVLVIVFGVYYFAMVNNRGEDEARALSFHDLDCRQPGPYPHKPLVVEDGLPDAPHAKRRALVGVKRGDRFPGARFKCALPARTI